MEKGERERRSERDGEREEERERRRERGGEREEERGAGGDTCSFITSSREALWSSINPRYGLPSEAYLQYTTV